MRPINPKRSGVATFVGLLLLLLMAYCVGKAFASTSKLQGTDGSGGATHESELRTPLPTSTPCPRCPVPTLTLTPTITPTPCPMNFADVRPGDYFYDAVRFLYCRSAITGYGDSFRPADITIRGQLSKIVVIAMGWDVGCPLSGHFSDVAPDNVFYCYIETAFSHGIISGYRDGTFRPSNAVSRGQLTKIVVLAMGWDVECPADGHFSDVPVGSAFYCYIETIYSRGAVSGYDNGTFQPGSIATRGQISKIVYLAIVDP